MVQPRIASNNQLSIQQMCEAGLGLALMGSMDVQEALQAGRLVRLLPQWSFGTLDIWAVRAGVSRGAQLHHFPTKNDLVVAAVGHLTEVRGAELADAARRLAAGPHRTRAVLGMLGDHFTSPVFTAALELWVAARTDPSLLAAVAPLEQSIGREVHRVTVELLGADESRPGVRELVQATLDLVRGLGLASTITDDTRRRGRILDRWAATLDAALAEAP